MENTQGIEGLWDTDTQGRLVWFQTAESILTFGHLLWPTLEPLVLHLKRLLRSLKLIEQCLKQTENCAGFTVKYPTEIFLKLVQGLTIKLSGASRTALSAISNQEAFASLVQSSASFSKWILVLPQMKCG